MRINRFRKKVCRLCLRWWYQSYGSTIYKRWLQSIFKLDKQKWHSFKFKLFFIHFSDWKKFQLLPCYSPIFFPSNIILLTLIKQFFDDKFFSFLKNCKLLFGKKTGWWQIKFRYFQHSKNRTNKSDQYWNLKFGIKFFFSNQ